MAGYSDRGLGIQRQHPRTKSLSCCSCRRKLCLVLFSLFRLVAESTAFCCRLVPLCFLIFAGKPCAFSPYVRPLFRVSAPKDNRPRAFLFSPAFGPLLSLKPGMWKPRFNFIRIHCRVDVKDLKTYQQVYLYVVPIITNMMFLNAIVVPVRLFWFRQRLRQAGIAREVARNDEEEARPATRRESQETAVIDEQAPALAPAPSPPFSAPQRTTTITFDDKAIASGYSRSEKQVLRIPNPRESDRGAPITEIEPGLRRSYTEEDPDAIKPLPEFRSGRSRRSSFHAEGTILSAATSIEKAATSAFILGKVQLAPRRQADRETLGGIEYRALKLLLKFVFGYFFGLHFFGAICLLPWIHNAPSKYLDVLAESGVGATWWAFYSAQTMSNNLGFALTPDSMASFKDATWPLLVMTFLAFAGNTCYPVFLRCIIWLTSLMVPKNSQTRETIQFILDHPRRCYTLLFPSRPTWILFGIVVILNFVDVVLIIVLDLDNPAVNDLPVGPRILSSLFQAASARHTGTATLSLVDVNPAVQFSLLTMMYIAVFPIAISVRASNTYEERTIGIWAREENLNEDNGVSYVMVHVRNQLTFDLWYIFLGTFLICIAESTLIMDVAEPTFSIFAVLFEVTSAYKVVICAMMIRGRHRGLPYALDRAITLPSEHTLSDESSSADQIPKSLSLGRTQSSGARSAP
ncbi:high-affinity potassium transport protein [Verticillium dahliae VdLs.17]|uniref:High-affinity potassium transport protein n=1 Tax=Verticillium dahliae (strain VdLs.17 / ATCC MYA-4575 / FGSC 10137) TaxID=498257 RepID=G2X4Q9_VERDV|nr:high-affinity potassium transport protein [Verticillium dahliae VdLs.17]EGY23703.1 high-affinity potassium transport protein [Verticillium dahliae VdLs.17]